MNNSLSSSHWAFVLNSERSRQWFSSSFCLNMTDCVFERTKTANINILRHNQSTDTILSVLHSTENRPLLYRHQHASLYFVLPRNGCWTTRCCMVSLSKWRRVVRGRVCPGVVSINNVYKMKAVGLLVALRSRNKKQLQPITQLGILTTCSVAKILIRVSSDVQEYIWCLDKCLKEWKLIRIWDIEKFDAV